MRIVEFERRENRLDAIFIEEREAYPASLGGWSSTGSSRDADRLRYFDRYFLMDRATGKAQPAHASDVGTIRMNSLVILYRRLSVSGESDWRDGVLIKVRFECDHRFERPFEVHGITAMLP